MPTSAQLEEFFRTCLTLSNLFIPVNLVRIDGRTNRLVILASDTLGFEILPNGKRIFL
jgi:hypothetical protein